jgi:IS30 family transposase
LIEALIRKDLSPEQISDRLKKKRGVLVSHERIYQHILADKRVGGDLYRHLRCQKKRKKRYGSYDRRGVLPNRVSIEDRPAVAGRHAASMLRPVGRTMLAEDLRQLYHVMRSSI